MIVFILLLLVSVLVLQVVQSLIEFNPFSLITKVLLDVYIYGKER